MPFYAYNLEKAIYKYINFDICRSIWFCMKDNTIPTHGEYLVGSKYLPNTSD
jgi:hypothetical protein